MAIFKNKKIISGLFIILSIITICSLSMAVYLKNKDNSFIIEPVLASTILEDNKPTNTNIFVEVKGAVKKPGVYQVNSNTIINDVIKLAGGFSKNAWSNNINLSRRVTNELVIYVFTKSEYKNQKKKNENISQIVTSSSLECKSNGYLIDNCTDNTVSIINSSENIIPEVIDKNEENNHLININTASLNELLNLPGIGSSKAQAIVDYRTNNGLFQSKEDIVNVSGISEKMYENIKELITI